MKRYAMVVDLRRCAGCHACTVSCKSEHLVPIGRFRTRVESIEVGMFPKVKRHFIPMLCNQCEDAPCISSCPTSAIVRRVDGIVIIEDDLCVGSGSCVTACPYDAIYMDEQTGTADKCDFCADRIDDGREPSCVSSCPTDAFVFGDANDSNDQIHHFLKDESFRGLKEELGAKPHVFYFPMEEQVEKKVKGINTPGLIKLEAANRRDVLHD